ncbi:MAG: 2-C-methyl-D-erythritol 4-phosphate cytidylyltransferase [Clostridiales Family XIII bacterium]|jgi:2-C-methyl-D-erythritol 4-phosphate cytidylyltransferase|nr:2-C-methyl-D-erythritol 4-phosphate cytidylyltransferase [Clostridiales Family XIII bacterium]
MNTALIFAGGTGKRMSSYAKPKQFLELHGKPIIIYTLEHFERHEDIDNILVVCLSSWIREFRRMLGQHGVTKVIGVAPGGDGGDESIYNGLLALQDVCSDEDVVLIHDGVRPLICEGLITECIRCAAEFGTAITAARETESVMLSHDGFSVDAMPKREEVYSAKAPQAFKYGLIWSLYQRARAEGVRTIDSSHLCSVYGQEMRLVPSPANNIKITAPTDYYIFRALFEAMENRQILGV